MTINRKDTILIAVLMNIGLLTVLFITAMSFEETSPLPEPAQPSIVQAPTVKSTQEYRELIAKAETPRDEVDSVLKAYTEKAKPEPKKVKAPEPSNTNEEETKADYVEITVKRGDSLDRIARANKTTVKKIQKLNDLKTDRLRIGQVLKIPLPDSSLVQAQKPSKTEAEDVPPGAVFYELKSGDNPWKVAKNFQISYEKIIQLNDLDDEKAKSLKPGDKIRIK